MSRSATTEDCQGMAELYPKAEAWLAFVTHGLAALFSVAGMVILSVLAALIWHLFVVGGKPRHFFAISPGVLYGQPGS